eukprot:1579071-Rhodomonas_salina.1
MQTITKALMLDLWCCRDLSGYSEKELDELFFASIDSLSYMDEIYKSLMGDGWSYTAGALGETWYMLARS